MKIICLVLLSGLLSFEVIGQYWTPVSTSMSTTTSDANETSSIQLTYTGWGRQHGILFNAIRSTSQVNGPLATTGNTKYVFGEGGFGGGAGAIMFLGNGGRMDFFISPLKTTPAAAGDNVEWGDPVMSMHRNGYVGVGVMSPDKKFMVREWSSTESVSTLLRLEQANYGNPEKGTGVAVEFGVGNNSNNPQTLGKISVENTAWTNKSRMIFSTKNEGSGMKQHMVINDLGRVGIGTLEPDALLTVKGSIHTQEVNVDMAFQEGPDYVFEKEYNLLPLSELETYINQNKHLPEVPSAKEMEANGLNLKEMNLILLKKVEELTLHLIEQNKVIAGQNERIKILEKEIK